jgi:glycosyltransferase involved in cell wall biosynthesis
VVVGGYSVFAEQAAMALSLARRVPYLIHSESTLAVQRPPVRRAAKRILVGSAVRGAAAGLATGSQAARYLTHYGLSPDRIRLVPNTIDVAAYGAAAAAARARDAELRATWGLPDRFVLFAGRLVEDKGVLDLLAAYRRHGGDAPPLVVAGEGRLEDDVRGASGVEYVGFVQPDRLIELLALAEWAVVPSHREPWGVIVNEALACGTPVVVTDRVGAAGDLVENGVNGRVVPAGDPAAIASALAGPQPSGDPSRGRIERWTHEFAVEQFLEAVRIAVDRR